MAKKKITLKEPNRLETSDLLHWAKRIKGDEGNAAIDIRKATMTAESLSEAAALSLAIKLISGKGPKTLLAAFKAQVEKNVEVFMKERPDYEYKIGGRQPQQS